MPAGSVIASSRGPRTASVHQALFYRDPDEYLGGIVRFASPGLEANETVIAAVPPPRLRLLRRHFDGEVKLIDMAELGRNPGWIIPAVRAMVDDQGGNQVHYVGEPIWAGRSPEEIVEATRHEALINLAFADLPVRILCPYDEGALDKHVLANARCTHPEVLAAQAVETSPTYTGPDSPPGCDEPLPQPPARAIRIDFETAGLQGVRTVVAQQAAAAGLRAERAADAVMAVHELAANAVRHGGGDGTLRIWSTAHRLIGEIRSGGRIADPLAGNIPPEPTRSDGRGIWLVHQLCDLVETRTGPAGTVTRVQIATG